MAVVWVTTYMMISKRCTNDALCKNIIFKAKKKFANIHTRTHKHTKNNFRCWVYFSHYISDFLFIYITMLMLLFSRYLYYILIIIIHILYRHTYILQFYVSKEWQMSCYYFMSAEKFFFYLSFTLENQEKKHHDMYKWVT